MGAPNLFFAPGAISPRYDRAREQLIVEISIKVELFTVVSKVLISAQHSCNSCENSTGVKRPPLATKGQNSTHPWSCDYCGCLV